MKHFHHQQASLGNLGGWSLEWSGWRSRVDVLPRCGWDVRHEYDPFKDAIRLGFRHSQAPFGYGVIMVSTLIDTRQALSSDSGFVRIQQVYADRDRIRVETTSPCVWGGEDGQVTAARFRELPAVEWFGFSQEETTPSGIIVTSDNVQKVLDAIREYQAPTQAEIRMRSNSAARGTERVEAQIISIAA